MNQNFSFSATCPTPELLAAPLIGPGISEPVGLLALRGIA